MTVEDPPPGAPAAALGRVAARARSSAWHCISAEQGYLRSELFNRQTVEDTREFLEAVLAAALHHHLPLVLISVRNSVPIFTLERYGFSHYLEVAFKSRYKIALVGDALELRIAHQYVASLARMRGVRLRAFSEESSAIAWLKAGESSQH